MAITAAAAAATIWAEGCSGVYHIAAPVMTPGSRLLHHYPEWLNA